MITLNVAGKPYRSVLVIGGSGFIGSRLAGVLTANGCRVLVPTRRYDRAKHLLVLPTVEIVEADVHDEAVLERLTVGVDAVINLVGILHAKAGASGSSYGAEFAKAHVALPEKIAAACSVNKVRHFLHMSALGADAHAPSMYLRSKADGEAAVLSQAALAVTVFRPSVVFGEQDHFLNLFAHLQKFLPLMLLGAADAKFQPVYVGDVAQAFVNAMGRPAVVGKVIELAGPAVYTLRELVKLAGLYSGHPRPVLSLPHALAWLQAWLLEMLPGDPLMSRDNLASMSIDNVASDPFAAELGLTLAAVEAVAPYYLAGRRASIEFDGFRMRAQH